MLHCSRRGKGTVGARGRRRRIEFENRSQYRQKLRVARNAVKRGGAATVAPAGTPPLDVSLRRQISSRPPEIENRSQSTRRRLPSGAGRALRGGGCRMNDVR